MPGKSDTVTAVNWSNCLVFLLQTSGSRNFLSGFLWASSFACGGWSECCTIYGWAPSMVQSFSPPLKILAITASTIFTLTIVLIPAALPQLATILYLQRDLEHLAAELMRAVDVGAAQEFKQLLGKVWSTKRRWEGFLFWHFLLNGTGTIMYALEEVFAFNHATVVMNAPMNWAGPLVAVFLLWQVTCVARFNGQICLCLETTDNDTLHRLLCQHKNKLEFSVLGLSITFTKIKAVMTSVIFSVISKAVIALVSLKVWCLQRMEYLFGKFRKARKVSPSPILHPALSCSARACGKTSAYDMEWQYAQEYLAKYARLTHWSPLSTCLNWWWPMLSRGWTSELGQPAFGAKIFHALRCLWHVGKWTGPALVLFFPECGTIFERGLYFFRWWIPDIQKPKDINSRYKCLFAELKYHC